MKIRLFFTAFLFSLISLEGLSQSLISGRVLSSDDRKPLAGAIVKVAGSSRGVITDDKGGFLITVKIPQEFLIISFLGYQNSTLTLSEPPDSTVLLYLTTLNTQFEEIVVSTGYEKTPRERATGSFAFINQDLINRSPGSNILNRLEDVVSGLTFNRDGSTQGNSISIRSLGTIYANDQPLIIIDNFAYEGDIQNINPSDVESVTVLKDAAAASIWGARAGNGVIVITTKKGKVGKQQVTGKSDVVWGAAPDLFRKPQMTVSEFVGVEIDLFKKGYYSSAENAQGNPPLTPVIELLIAGREGKITNEQVQTEIARLEGKDIRKDYERYLYRSSLLQQYALSLSGGNETMRYYVSSGYDHSRSSAVGDQYSRFTLNASNNFSFLKSRLAIGTGIYFSTSRDHQNKLKPVSFDAMRSLYPYGELADDSGMPLSIVKDYRAAFVGQAESQGLLPWTYVPLDELRLNDNMAVVQDFRFNLNANYEILKGLRGEMQYQAGLGSSLLKEHFRAKSYFVRDLVNNYSQINENGTLSYGIPKGGILDQSNNVSLTHNLRGQLTYKKTFNQKHDVSVLSGAEIYSGNRRTSRNRFYGYEDSHATLKPVDYLGLYTQYSYPVNRRVIPFRDGSSHFDDRSISYYFNGAYSYAGKYTVTTSARLDQSNLFGVKTNLRSVPLYSGGISWNVAQESFYRFAALPYLRLRATYGYNGNMDKTISAYTTAYYISAAAHTRLPYAQIINPPNPQLKWERVGVLNLAIDWRSASSRWKGSVEYYSKRSTDLIGDTPYAPSSGITSFRGNIANMTSQGIDVEINRKHTAGKIMWQSTLLMSYAADKVRDYKIQSSTINYLHSVRQPLNDRPLFSLYALEWAGLDSADGSPRGLLNGEKSSDYAAILQTTRPSDLLFYAGRPRIFGSIRNDLVYKKFSLSFNIAYRLAYFFRRESVFYSDILTANGGHSDFSLRWRQAGDELKTQVPSMPEVVSTNRDYMYRYSEELIENGNHIRMRDVRLQYTVTPRRTVPVQVYIYANNIGLLYVSNRHGLDPDYPVMRPPLLLSLGFNCQL